MTVASLAKGALVAFAVSSALIADGVKDGAKEIECSRVKGEPRLDYEFRMVTRDRIRVPAEQFAGEASSFKLKTTVQVVETRGARDAPIREPAIQLEHTFRKPPVPEKTDEAFQFGSLFAFGDGVYRADWSLETPDGRSCQLTWTIDATRGPKRRQLPSSLGPGEVVSVAALMYRPEDSVVGVERPLRLKVFYNLDPRQRYRPLRTRPARGPEGGGIGGPRGGGGGGIGAPRGGGGGAFGWPRGRSRRGGGRGSRAGRQRISVTYGIGVLRSFSRDPRIGEVSLVAYSVEDRETVLRHDFAAGFDYPALRGISRELDPNTVELGDLDPESDNVFFGQMLVREMAEADAADLYVFIGADAQMGEQAPEETFREIGKPAGPVFYLNNTPRASWSGLIENSAKDLGGREVNAHSPEDFWKAMKKMLAPMGDS